MSEGDAEDGSRGGSRRAADLPAILFVSPFSPLRVGGVGQFLLDVGVRLTQDGVRISFLHAREPAAMEMPDALEAAPREEVPTGGPRGLRTLFTARRTAKRILAMRGTFDVCHALVPTPLTTVATVLSRAIGRRAVATIFAPYPKDPNPFAELAQRLAERLTLWMADEVVYECQATRRRFPREGVVIYNGIDTGYYAPNPGRRREFRARHGIPDGAVVFLYAGRITPLKGVKDLVESFQGLEAGVREKAIVLFVGPIETTEPEAVFPPGTLGADRIRHHGPVGKYAIADYYQGCDVFVLPSYWEGISSSLVEAMACGLPAIVSSAGGSPEVVVDGQSGLVHEPGDVEGLRGCLREMVLRPDTRASMGREARARIMDGFEIRGMVRRYRDVYDRVRRQRAPVRR